MALSESLGAELCIALRLGASGSLALRFVLALTLSAHCAQFRLFNSEHQKLRLQFDNQGIKPSGYIPAAVITVIEEFGNTSSAAMGIALDTLQSSKRVEAGDILLLPAFAAGFTWGAGLFRAKGV